SVYSKNFGVGMFTTKNDVMSLLESCNLSLSYSLPLQFVCMVLQLPSHSAYDNVVREITRKYRLYNVEKVDPGQWGVHRIAFSEDIERMLFGCDFNALNPVRFVVVQFPSNLDAINIVLEKNMSFWLNTQISMRVLQ
ncbi:hypothetical protein MKX01_031865, partial [Papaver californicum]